MSEQEKKEAVVTEGTVIETPDERSWLKRFADSHPKAWKWAKRIGCAIGVGGGMTLAFAAGKACGGRTTEALKITEGTEPETELTPEELGDFKEE